MNLENLTIEQFMKLQLIIETFKSDESKVHAEVIKFLHGTLDIPKKESDITINNVIDILNEKPDFVHRFEYKGVEYGFIPNLDEITTGEFIDLDEYMKEGKQLHKIASILYRPVTKRSGTLYQIEKYEGTNKFSDVMLGVNYKIVLGAMVFFWNLSKSLLEISNTYTAELLEKQKKTKKSS